MLNKYYRAGQKAKELLNLNNEYNPYIQHSREHLLWKLGNKHATYTEERYEEIILQDNEDFFDDDTNRD